MESDSIARELNNPSHAPLKSGEPIIFSTVCVVIFVVMTAYKPFNKNVRAPFLLAFQVAIGFPSSSVKHSASFMYSMS